MKRRYQATIDNGRDYVTFNFYSEHRANSRANVNDCKREYLKRKGKACFRIINITLYK